jgi:hypothetical protein
MTLNLWIGTNISEKPVVTIVRVGELFCTEEGDDRFCQNADTFITNYMTTHPRDCNFEITWFYYYKLNFYQPFIALF